MAKQIVYVDDGSIGATGDAAIVYDSSANTLTTTNAISATALTLSSTLTGGAATDIALNTDKFTVDATQGDTVIAGTLTQTGAVAAAASITLGAGADVIGSSTSDITINTNKFTVAGATGNTVVAGTLTQTGAVAAAASITLGAGADLIGSSTSDITINTDKFTTAGATGNTAIGGTLAVTGNTTHTGTIIGGAATDITLNTDKFTVDATNGNTVIAGTLTQTGAATLAGVLTCNAAAALGATANAAAHGAVALDITELFTLVSSDADSDQAATLADGANGQLKIIKMEADGGNDVVLTPANFRDGSTITFDTANEILVLVFGDATWNLVYTDATVA